MAQRKVTRTRKAADGTISALCNPSEFWSPVSSDEAIRQIKNKIHRYQVDIGAQTVDIHVVGSNPRYLRTDPDRTTANNLLELPDC